MVTGFPKVRVQIPIESTVFSVDVIAVLKNREIFSLAFTALHITSVDRNSSKFLSHLKALTNNIIAVNLAKTSFF